MRSVLKRAIFQLMPKRDFVPNAACIAEAPSAQSTVETVGGWHSAFPAGSGIDTGGYFKAFSDARVSWAVEKLGGVHGADILELGPFEGGHTYMFDRAGANSITAIEGLKSAYLKCLVAKELLGMKSATFLLGNFVPWLEREARRFDLIWASGVLYHSTEPLKLLQLIAAHTDRVFIWTHFYPDNFAPTAPFPTPIVGVRNVAFEGRTIPHFDRSYVLTRRAGFCGGVYSGCSWLRRGDILDALAYLGFANLDIAFEANDTNDQGPSFAILARKKEA
jgi:hypothetical protein